MHARLVVCPWFGIGEPFTTGLFKAQLLHFCVFVMATNQGCGEEKNGDILYLALVQMDMYSGMTKVSHTEKETAVLLIYLSSLTIAK